MRAEGVGRRAARLALAVAAVAAAGFVFVALWWGPLIYFEGLRELRHALPVPTTWVVAVARSGLPLACALASIVALPWLLHVGGPRAAWGIAAVAAFAALWAAATVVALVLPLELCAFHWPDLPWQTGDAPTTSGCRLDD